jgi:hypothetical protein
LSSHVFALCSVIKFDRNSAVLVNPKGIPIGTRVLGFVTHELRARQMMKVRCTEAYRMVLCTVLFLLLRCGVVRSAMLCRAACVNAAAGLRCVWRNKRLIDVYHPPPCACCLQVLSLAARVF